MQDKILIVVAMGALILFCGIVIFFVAEPDLIVITTLVLFMAVYDFWVSVFRRARPRTVSGDALENRPGGASGKTLGSAREGFGSAAKPRSKPKKKG
ncbi:MAG: hypothetical protein AB7U38_06715 [Hyphomicrobiales bacterium]